MIAVRREESGAAKPTLQSAFRRTNGQRRPDARRLRNASNARARRRGAVVRRQRRLESDARRHVRRRRRSRRRERKRVGRRVVQRELFLHGFKARSSRISQGGGYYGAGGQHSAYGGGSAGGGGGGGGGYGSKRLRDGALRS